MGSEGSEDRVNLETDFEQSIDEINSRKLDCNGAVVRKRRSGKNPDYRDNSDSESSHSERNGYLLPSPNKKKKSKSTTESHQRIPGGKPFSHQMREKKMLVPRIIVKSGGKPRSMMLEMSSNSSKNQESGSKKKSPKDKSYYHSQITEDNHTIKIKIRKTIADVKKSKRKKHLDNVVLSSLKQAKQSGSHHKKKHKEQQSSKGKSTSTSTVVVSTAGEKRPIASVVLGPPAVMQPTVLVTPTNIKPKETKKKSSSSKGSKSQAKVVEERPPVQQTPWGSSMPQEVLVNIFTYLVNMQGTLPTLLKVGEVCKLWHSASTTPQLWTNVELSQHTKDKWKTDQRLLWLMENRLSMCQHLNLSNWKVSNLGWVLESLVACCPHLEELNLTGWKRLSVEQLRDLSQGLTKLARLDLSYTSEASSSGGCLSVVSLTQMSRGMATRLTHLTLANNKLAGLPSILNSIADHCPNLELLDLSNLWAVSHPAMVPLERLQKGCCRLKILRITNSQVVLASATPQDQMESPGFPLLEELSVACQSVDYKLVDDEALGRILKGSTCLKLLDVRGCIRITDSGLIKVPAWDLQHLFLSGCAVTRQCRSCLELICEKWSHSLVEVDLAWATATQPLDAAVDALADKGKQSKLRILNLCGSSVSLEPVKRILTKCPNLESVNLASCRALPRGMKRHYMGQELQDLRDSFDPVKRKEKEEQERLAKEKKKKAMEEAKKNKEDSNKLKDEDIKSPDNSSQTSEKEENKADSGSTPTSASDSPAVVQASPSVNVNSNSVSNSNNTGGTSTEHEYSPLPNNTFSPAPKSTPSAQEPFSPQPSTSGISTPRSNLQEYSPASSLVTTDQISASNMCDSDSRQGTPRASSGWNTEQCSPMNKQDTLSSSQPSPDTRYSPANAMRQDTPKSASSWNIGNYSPSVSRQESPYPSHSPSVHRQESPYSSQNSPSIMRQESPYSSQKSPSVVRLESPYSSQKSPSVASPYSSQIRSPSVVRQESPYSSVKSPSVIRQESPYSSVKSPSMVRQESPYSSHVSPSVVRQESPYSSHVSPSVVRQESPYSSHVSPSVVRQESPYSSHVSPSVVSRQESPYSSQKSPYQSVKSPYTSQKSPDPPLPNKTNQSSGNWGVEQYSPIMRQETASSSQPSPETTPQVIARPWNLERFSPMQSNVMVPSPDTSQVTSTGKQWNLERYSPMTRPESSPAAAPSPEISTIKSTWNMGHPSLDTGPIIKSGWNNSSSHFNPLLRPDQTPTGPLIAHMDAHKTGWLNPFNSAKVDSSSIVIPNTLPSIGGWGLSSSVVVNNTNSGSIGGVKSGGDILQRTASGYGPTASDQVSTTTYCANPEQSMLYRNFRDPINGPSGVE